MCPSSGGLSTSHRTTFIEINNLFIKMAISPSSVHHFFSLKVKKPKEPQKKKSPTFKYAHKLLLPLPPNVSTTKNSINPQKH